jgi:SAM-dependent methyltransferase
MVQKTGEVQADYDRLAEEYARHISDELRRKPLDRQLLDRFANEVRSAGKVCDLGCGPGHIARYLHACAVAVCGLDLSAKMVEQARSLNPGIEFLQGDMLALPVEDAAWAGIVAFYSIVNFPPNDLLAVMREMRRCLQPGSRLLLSFHIGDKIEHVQELWGCVISLDFYFFSIAQVTENMRAVGLEIEDIIEREPYAPEIEYQSRRAYIFAKVPRSGIQSRI